MLVDIPEHYRANLANAMLTRANEAIISVGYVSAYLHQFADLWERGVNYGNLTNDTFWQTLSNAYPGTTPYLDGLL